MPPQFQAASFYFTFDSTSRSPPPSPPLSLCFPALTALSLLPIRLTVTVTLAGSRYFAHHFRLSAGLEGDCRVVKRFGELA